MHKLKPAFECAVVLPNCMASPITIKFDEVTAMKEDGNQLETTSTEINDESMVSCMSACLKCCAQRTITQSYPSRYQIFQL
jgi:hypothetical protein